MLMTRNTAELDNKRQRVKALQQLVDELNRDLYKISVEKQALLVYRNSTTPLPPAVPASNASSAWSVSADSLCSRWSG